MPIPVKSTAKSTRTYQHMNKILLIGAIAVALSLPVEGKEKKSVQQQVSDSPYSTLLGFDGNAELLKPMVEKVALSVVANPDRGEFGQKAGGGYFEKTFRDTLSGNLEVRVEVDANKKPKTLTIVRKEYAIVVGGKSHHEFWETTDTNLDGKIDVGCIANSEKDLKKPRPVFSPADRGKPHEARWQVELEWRVKYLTARIN